MPYAELDRYKYKIAAALVFAGVALSFAHVWIFKDRPTFLFYLALDVVFLPIQVLLVSVILDHLLKNREKRSMLAKMNMVVGAFFSEVGNELLRRFADFCQDPAELAEQLRFSGFWDQKDFIAAVEFAAKNECKLESDPEQLEALKRFLDAKRGFIVGLLQNPNLLEHDRFTDLLWAVSHLSEELAARDDFETLPHSDLEHLKGDVKRAFSGLLREWLQYLIHLKKEYPYIYSLAVRTNPFNPAASPVVKG